MKYTFLFLLFPFFCIAQSTVSVTTLNCEFLSSKNIHVKYGEKIRLSKAKKKEWTPIRAEKYLNSAQNVASSLKRIDSDVYALTEIGTQDDLEELLLILKDINPEYKYFAVAKSKDTYTAQNVGVISKYPIQVISKSTDERTLYFPEEDELWKDASETGISKYGLFMVDLPKESFLLGIAHLVSEAGGAEKDAQRLAQASILRRLTLKEGVPLILAGDLNAAKGSPVTLRIRGFNDIFPELYTCSDSRFTNGNSVYTYNFKGYRSQIDHIFFNAEFKNLLKSRKPLKTQTISVPEDVSDHKALYVEFSLKN